MHHPERSNGDTPEHSTAQLLWIDAVCIDQTNIAERNAQVAMMAKIYGSGSGMIIWLGEDHESSDDYLAYQALRNVLCCRDLVRQYEPLEDETSEPLREFAETKFGFPVIRRQALQVAYQLHHSKWSWLNWLSQFLVAFALAHMDEIRMAKMLVMESVLWSRLPNDKRWKAYQP
jgi:hypothetical protein